MGNEGGVTMPGSCDDLPNMPSLPTGCAIDTGYTDDLTVCTQGLAKQEMTLPQFSACTCNAFKSFLARVPACNEGGVTMPWSCDDLPNLPNMPSLPTDCAIDTGYTDDLTACTQGLHNQEMTLPQFAACTCIAFKSFLARVPVCNEGGVTMPWSCDDAPVAPTPVAPSPVPTPDDKSTKQSTD